MVYLVPGVLICYPPSSGGVATGPYNIGLFVSRLGYLGLDKISMTLIPSLSVCLSRSPPPFTLTMLLP